ncbi:acetamidase/formamidase family protein [Paenibacillus sp. DYY-L-2]|uniref:acetamidase/formamidase family protein n=1 Tax=Paenibacillus sp. DYY-L-2 TaxID=3447013 RepID=UPI003F50671E
MAIYDIHPEPGTIHGSFSRENQEILTINSGDTIRFRTLDAGWGTPSNQGERIKPVQRRDGIDTGHALCGPIKINGAKKGMVLAITINRIVPGPYGFTSAGRYPNWQNKRLNLLDCEEINLEWKLNNQTMVGTCEVNGRKFSVTLRPFMGILGMPPDEPGYHETWPPRYCGGNIDCKELVSGSTLFLPISVDGAMVSVGDGHAAQGDGEVSCQAIECPMEMAEITFSVIDDMSISIPRAKTPTGWITFGFHEDLNEATVLALDGMLNLMGELFGLSRVETIALGSAVIDLRITQIVNGVKGVHAFLPDGALR